MCIDISNVYLLIDMKCVQRFHRVIVMTLKAWLILGGKEVLDANYIVNNNHHAQLHRTSMLMKPSRLCFSRVCTVPMFR